MVSEHANPIEMGAYEELRSDTMQRIPARFARQDYVEEAWRIGRSGARETTPVYEYEPGTWGPKEAQTILAPEGGWDAI